MKYTNMTNKGICSTHAQVVAVWVKWCNITHILRLPIFTTEKYIQKQGMHKKGLTKVKQKPTDTNPPTREIQDRIINTIRQNSF